jgi:hypothetical protein
MCRYLRFGLRVFLSHRIRDIGHEDVEFEFEFEFEKDGVCGFVVGDSELIVRAKEGTGGLGRERKGGTEWSHCGILL